MNNWQMAELDSNSYLLTPNKSFSANPKFINLTEPKPYGKYIVNSCIIKKKKMLQNKKAYLIVYHLGVLY